jgi:catechol 2,3-dioxygenase-like lactoylglutathione lyase family enzyme
MNDPCSGAPPTVGLDSIGAVTLVTRDMARAVAFYQALGLELTYGGPGAEFSSLRFGRSFVNLTRSQAAEGDFRAWGRVIFRVDDVDAMHARALAFGMTPDFAPRDASWGERYFHMTDPDGHGLSFARPLDEKSKK